MTIVSRKVECDDSPASMTNLGITPAPLAFEAGKRGGGGRSLDFRSSRRTGVGCSSGVRG